VNRRKLKSQNQDYNVGYGRPPAHTRFRRGVSGNPGGRPRGRTASRLDHLILKEAYRPITVRDGEQVMSLPAVQAVIRALIARAAKGNGPAQRLLVSVVTQIEQELAASKTETDEYPRNIRSPGSARRMRRLMASSLSRMKTASIISSRQPNRPIHEPFTSHTF
jgi:hypothetical protein